MTGPAHQPLFMNPRATWLFMGQWILILILSIGFIVLYVDNDRTKTCLGGYMQKDSAATKVRAGFAEEERAAFAKVMSTLVGQDEAGFKASVIAYDALLKKDDKLRAANPYPPFPEGC